MKDVPTWIRLRHSDPKYPVESLGKYREHVNVECTKHKRYRALRYPYSKCPKCIEIYELAKRLDNAN